MTAQTAPIVHADIPNTITSSVAQRIRGEYTEMPGLTLTVRQAARLWGLDVPQSQHLLSQLVESRFLVENSGAYRRRGCPRCS